MVWILFLSWSPGGLRRSLLMHKGAGSKPTNGKVPIFKPVKHLFVWESLASAQMGQLDRSDTTASQDIEICALDVLCWIAYWPAVGLHQEWPSARLPVTGIYAAMNAFDGEGFSQPGSTALNSVTG
uniref:SFRICE_025136 n=1 Tax=Spodoptera frugiperda TaxID=7108 RepID=A0A2H1WL74_SPOFR